MPSTDPGTSTDDPAAEFADLTELFAELAGTDDEAGRDRLRAELVTGHLPLAQRIAHRYHNRGIPDDDLEQVAALGLVSAVNRFDPARGSDFVAFAVPTIMGEVRRHFRDSTWAVRMPRRLQELHLSIAAAVGELTQRLGRSPRPSEIAAELTITLAEVYEGLEASAAHTALSTDRTVTDESEVTIGETIADLDAGEPLDHVENLTALRPLLNRLPPRERRILILRFYDDLTQSQIAADIGLSQVHVSRILSQTLRQLRRQLTADDSAPAGAC